MISKEALLQMQQYAQNRDWNEAFGGASHGNKHLERIAQIAQFLARKEKARQDIVQAGALLHDMALPSGDDYDYEKSKILAHKELKQFCLEPGDEDVVAECIASHEGMVSPKSVEAQIVHDADVLEKSGMLGIIRHTWKLVNTNQIYSKSFSKKYCNTILEHLDWRASKIRTKSAKELHNKISIKTEKGKICDIIKEIVMMSEEGLITEQIAKMLVSDLSQNQQDMLASQLNLSYISADK